MRAKRPATRIHPPQHTHASSLLASLCGWAPEVSAALERPRHALERPLAFGWRLLVYASSHCSVCRTRRIRTLAAIAKKLIAQAVKQCVLLSPCALQLRAIAMVAVPARLRDTILIC